MGRPVTMCLKSIAPPRKFILDTLCVTLRINFDNLRLFLSRVAEGFGPDEATATALEPVSPVGANSRLFRTHPSMRKQGR